MGGAVSSGRDNDELIDNLKAGNFIRTKNVELAFRAVDRGEYLVRDGRQQAYKDLAWRSGPLHMSAPCIYSEVMENLELHANLSFLNIGSGTGYFSTMVGLILGSGGINHGVEMIQMVVDYANMKLKQFMAKSHALNEFDFAEPKFFFGNGLCLAPLQSSYDRVYCGAGCPEEYQNYFQQLIKVGGILVMPLNNNLVQIRRTSVTEWSSRNVLSVQFATLRVPQATEARDVFRLEELSPARLQVLSRGAVRACVRRRVLSCVPARAPPPPPPEPTHNNYPRRICIPIDDDSDDEQLNALHDLDRESGANEMNALLNLVLSMGANHVAGAIRFDTLDSASDTSDADTDIDFDDNDRPRPGNGRPNEMSIFVPPNGFQALEDDDEEVMKAETSQSNTQANQSDKLIDETINNSAVEDTTAANSNKASPDKNDCPSSHSHLNGNSSPKAGGSRSNLESDKRVDEPNDESNSKCDQSTSQSHQPTRSETMSELCDRTIYRALTGHDRPANSNEGDQGTRGKLSVTLEYNDPSDMVNLDSSSNEEGQQPPTTSNKKRRNRKRQSQSSLTSKVDEEESDSAKTDTVQEKSSDLSEDENVPETSASQGNGKAKRQKFDSGIGDGDSPSTSSPSRDNDVQFLDNDISSDEGDPNLRDYDECSSDTSYSVADNSDPRGEYLEARGLEITNLTVAAIQALPLPPPLKLYVNMNRPLPK